MTVALTEFPDRAAEIFYSHDSTSSGRRILVVDDDMDLRRLMVEFLNGCGYEADEAENGACAWEALHLWSYDLLLTDNEMPEMSGVQLVQKLRSAKIELPIIFASGRPLGDFMVKSGGLGFTTMLPKPFDLDELTNTIKRLLPSFDSNSQPWQLPSNQADSHANYVGENAVNA